MAQPVHDGTALDLPDDPDLRRREQMARWREKRRAWFAAPRFAMGAFHHFTRDQSRGKLDRCSITSPRYTSFRWVANTPRIMQTAADTRNPYERWSELTPAARAPYEAQAAPDEARYLADLVDYNARMPLSPSVRSSDGDSEFDSDEYWEYTSDRHQENEERRLAQIWNRYRRDHPKACGGALTPVPAEPFAFLRLPIELRRRIYGMLLSRDVQVRQLEFGSANDGAWEPIDVRIFAVSKQMHAEAIAVFYEKNRFFVRCSDNWHSYKLPLFIREASGMEPPRPAERVQRIHVQLGLAKKVECVLVRPQLEHLCDILKKGNKLLEIKITGLGSGSRDPELDQAFDQLLECFTVIRGVTKVVFMDLQGQRLEHGSNYSPIVGTVEQARRVKSIMESVDSIAPGKS